MTDVSTGYPRKRTQTRNRLIRAGLQVIADRGPEAATVGEIAKTAGVAPGTFYNHFATLDDLIELISDLLSTGVEIGSETLDLIENDHVIRVAVGILQLLDMVETDPVAAAAFARLVASKPEFRARIRGVVSNAIASGVRANRFDVEPSQSATNAVVGAVVQSMRSRLLNEIDADAAPELARLALRVLGVPGPETIDAVQRAMASMQTSADVLQ